MDEDLNLSSSIDQALLSNDVDLTKIIRRQQIFSSRTFGDGERTEGILKHIEYEVREVRDSGGDLDEWIDIVILALDGAWRRASAAGLDPCIDVAMRLMRKQTINELRSWPALGPEDEPIEHIRSAPSES